MRHVNSKRNSKEKNQRYHAKVRMLQHYGIQITNADLEKMAEIYRHNPDVAILYRPSNRIVKAAIPYKGTVYPIIYDKVRHQIVTVLKEEYLTPRQKKIFESCKNRQQFHQSIIGNKIELPKDLLVKNSQEEGLNEIKEENCVEKNDYVEIEEEKENKRLMEEAFKSIPKLT